MRSPGVGHDLMAEGRASSARESVAAGRRLPVGDPTAVATAGERTVVSAAAFMHPHRGWTPGLVRSALGAGIGAEDT